MSGVKARVAGVSTTSEAHPSTSLAFAVDSTPPFDTRVSHTAFDEGARNVNVTMARGGNFSVPSDTRGWRYSVDGACFLLIRLFVGTLPVL